MVNAGDVFLSILNGLLAVLGSTMNFLVILVISKNGELQNELNILMASLACADFFNSLLAQPLFVCYINGARTSPFKDVFEIMALVGLHASFNNLLGITINRVWVLCSPFSNALFVQWKRLATILTVIWLSSIGLGIFFYTKHGKLISPYTHAVMFSLFIFTYSYIFWIAWKQTKKIASQAQSLSHNHRATKVKSENSAARTSALLVGSSMLCFIPDIVYDFMGVVDEQRFSWAFTLLFLSSSLNPCIYVWRTQIFRSALRSTLSRLPLIRDHISSSVAYPVERSKQKPTRQTTAVTPPPTEKENPLVLAEP